MPRVTTGAKLAMYADDCKCSKSIESISDFQTIQEDLNSLLVWSTVNEMTFQPSKSENLRVSRKWCSPTRVYSLDGTSLKVVTSVRDLGIVITKDLTWSDHIN